MKNKFRLTAVVAALVVLSASFVPVALEAAANEVPRYQRPTLLIWDLDASGVRASAARQLSAQLATDMSKNPQLDVITRGELKKALQHSAQLQLMGADSKLLARLARSSKAQLLLFGSLSRHHKRYQLALKLFSASTAKVIKRQVLYTEKLEGFSPALMPQALALVEAALGKSALNIDDAAQLLAKRLFAAGAPHNKNYRVRSLLLDAGPFASPYGARLAAALQKALNRQVKDPQGLLHVSGSDKPFEDMIELAVQVQGHKKWRAQCLQVRGALDADMLRPANLQQAQQDQGALQSWHKSQQGMQLKIWTNKGRQGLVFFDDEAVQLYLRVNRPAWVRLIYYLADGHRVLLQDKFRIPAAQVGQDVAYPIKLSPAAPFGIERIQAVAFSHEPKALHTRQVEIDGSRYDLIPDLKTALIHRGFKKQIKNHEIDESLLNLTTAKKEP